MIKKYIILFLLIFIVVLNVSAQNRSGYIGKKNMVSVFTTLNFMLYNNSSSLASNDHLPHTVEFKKDNTKKEKYQIFRIDYRLSYQRILSNRFAIGLEYGREKVKIDSYAFSYFFNGDLVNGNINYSKYSSPVFNANSFLITLEFFQRSNISGQGFSTGFGIGPKLYNFNTKQNYRIDEKKPLIIDGVDSKLSYIAINAYFQMTYRQPITTFLSFEVGLRFHTGYVLRKNHNETMENLILWPESTINSELGRSNGFNLASLKTGFVFSL